MCVINDGSVALAEQFLCLFGCFLISVLCFHCLQLFPENGEDFVDYLKSINRLDLAAQKLAELLNQVSWHRSY